MILYIAGPMTGYPELNYPAFNEAEAKLKAAGYETRNPVDAEKFRSEGDDPTWQWYMKHALYFLLGSEGVATLPLWQRSRGAQLEVHVAGKLGYPIRTVDEWLEMA